MFCYFKDPNRLCGSTWMLLKLRTSCCLNKVSHQPQYSFDFWLDKLKLMFVVVSMCVCFFFFRISAMLHPQLQFRSTTRINLFTQSDRLSRFTPLRDKHTWSVSTAPGTAWSAVSRSTAAFRIPPTSTTLCSVAPEEPPLANSVPSPVAHLQFCKVNGVNGGFVSHTCMIEKYKRVEIEN